jgi:hypothetical protein
MKWVEFVAVIKAVVFEKLSDSIASIFELITYFKTSLELLLQHIFIL